MTYYLRQADKLASSMMVNKQASYVIGYSVMVCLLMKMRNRFLSMRRECPLGFKTFHRAVGSQ